jgi:hypothetical protein
MRGGRDVVQVERLDALRALEHGIELSAERFDLLVGELEAREPRDVLDLFPRYRHKDGA